MEGGPFTIEPGELVLHKSEAPPGGILDRVLKAILGR